MAQIEEIYHSHNGVDGYRSMTFYLERRGYGYSAATIHKYMNTELGLRSVVRPKKPDYEYGKPHKVFENKLKQDFTADAVNQKWCTDFTYLFLADHEVRYNCTIIDLYDRSVVASMTDRSITSDLAIRTLQKALDPQPQIKGGLILHSDQDSPYTSRAFVEFCGSSYVQYNHVRPHSFFVKSIDEGFTEINFPCEGFTKFFSAYKNLRSTYPFATLPIFQHLLVFL